jgi:cytochrome c biogenesis protein CcdA/glutaredoxin
MVGILLLLPVSGKTDDEAITSHQSAVNVVTIEIFIRGDSERCERAVRFLTSLTEQNDGLRLVVHDVLEDEAQLRRLWKLARESGYAKAVVPAVYSCQQLHCGFDDPQTTEPKIVELLTMHVYTRSTCPRCQRAKKFLSGLKRRWPGIHITIHEITGDTAARSQWGDLSRQYGVVPGLPSIHFAGRFIVGYRGDAETGTEIETLVRNSAGPSDVPKPVPKPVRQSRRQSGIRALQSISLSYAAALLWQASFPASTADSIPLPDESEDLPMPDGNDIGEPASAEQQDEVDDAINVPVFGELRISEIGLPAFTFAVGLVDGFNPCAMWVLVFLLSVLVNVKDRRRMILIAGTFVVVSGLAYFTFMVAWLNLFMLVGIARPVQICLGCLAVLIGIVNVKDFFAFGKGLSFSIPESQKPGIYARVRKIVSAKYLTAALWGALALAIVVNIVELLCTAGLPAMYSQVLMMQQLPAWANYYYLALYNVAYMLDDAMLLTVVVVTLSRSRLQEQHGRWLKLFSGAVILLLGLVMIFRPDWLQFEG